MSIDGLRRTERADRCKYVAVIPAFRLVPEPLTPDAAELPSFKWADAAAGTRHQIGGEPSLIAEDEFPSCGCGTTMTFYGQLDSINDEFCIADAGLVAVFVCFDCFEARAVVSSA
ncbi:MAG: hypothetical protein GY701_02590 [Sulfitobacter sp.]|nr:hypothetical protein [Sulfitobacter sp.]